MKKHLKRLILLLLALGCAVIFARNWIAREAIKHKMREVTGFEMEIGPLNAGIFNGMLSMREIRISNPPRFTDREFMEIGEFSIYYKPISILRGQPHITEMTIVLDNIVVVGLPDWDSNMKQMWAAGSLSRDDCMVERLNLQIGTVTYRSYDRDGKCSGERSIEVNTMTTHKTLQGSSGIMWAMMKTIILHGRLQKDNSRPGSEKSMIQKVMEKMSGIANPDPGGVESIDPPESN